MASRQISICQNKMMNKASWNQITRPPIQKVCSFHKQFREYKSTPLIQLNSLSQKIGVKKIWCKDESRRFGLKAYKVLGGFYAIACVLQERYELDSLNFKEMHASNFLDSDGLTFATMTDGNHGLGVAYVASKLGYRSEIYVPRQMVPARIEAIKAAAGTVTIFEGGYDDAARQIAKDAKKYGWQVISDTAWEGYTQIPKWIIEGYSTMFEEVRNQLADKAPTHIFIQAGVGSLASSLIKYFRTFYGNEEIKVVITEPNRANCFYRSAKINDGRAHHYPGEVDTMMAGLACAEPNPVAWPVIRDGADFMLSCSDEIAFLGMRKYYYPEGEDAQVISGESGAVTLGALYKIMCDEEYASTKSALGLNENSKILLINTEGDTDPVNFQKVING